MDDHLLSNTIHIPEMFNIFAQSKGYLPTLWATVGDGGCPLVLLLPLQMTLMVGALRRFSTRGILYGGVLCAHGAYEGTALEMLLRVYNLESDGVLFTELPNVSDLSDLQPVFHENGFVCEDHLNT